MRQFATAFILIFSVSALSQNGQSDFSGSVMARGYYHGEDPMPFWVYSNQRGRVSEETNFFGLIQGQYLTEFDNGDTLQAKLGVLYRNEVQDDIFFDEAYLEYKNPWMRVSIGKKHRPTLYEGVSASNENILWSLNAPALPGWELETTDTYYFDRQGKLGFEAMWADYLLGTNRHVRKAKVHRKYFRLVYRSDSNWKIKLGMQHFAQWGGVSPNRDGQPETFSDYIKIITGRGGGEAALRGDQKNALGNHLGSWEIYAEKEFRYDRIGFLVNSIFEDGAGSRLANFPDGRYGMYWTRKEKDHGINHIMYEFFYTRHQSHNTNIWGPDNYLDHAMTYNSGWTYQNRVIGAPFFMYDKEEGKIINNKFSAHHIGIVGQYDTYWRSYPYKFMMSFAHNEGTYSRGIQPNSDVFSLYTEGRILPNPFEINLILSASYGNLQEPFYGVGVQLKKEF